MNVRIPIVAIFSIFLWVSTTSAALDSVSGYSEDGSELVPITAPATVADRANVAYSLANGFPIWYWDGTTVDVGGVDTPLKLQLCLDKAVEKVGGGIFRPCFTEEPLAGSPISFPNNFGAEAFWWAATAESVFSSRQGVAIVEGGDMLFVAGLEAAFGAGLGAIDGDQVAFSRIRLRISVPRPGIYRVIHPYGTFDYTITDPGRRAINQTQDLGSFDPPGPPPAGDFIQALLDGPSPPAVFDPFANVGAVDAEGRSIGPFLIAADAPGGSPLPLIEAVNGDLYLADPGFGAIHLEVPVAGSSFEFDPINSPGEFADFFRLELLSLLEVNDLGNLEEVDPASLDFFLNAENDSQVVEVTQFQIMGKLFDDGPNLKPLANDDGVVIPMGRTARIDVLLNDEDPVGADNVHGINPQALGLPTDLANLRDEIILTGPMETAAGGTVERSTAVATGQAVFVYTPPSPDFTGEDSFSYVVQDTGGLISDPALVTVIVESLEAGRAEYRPRLGKWRIEGTSSHTESNVVTLLAGPVATLTGDAVLPTPVATEARGMAALSLGDDRIDYTFSVDPLPASEVIFATIHITAPEETTGPSVLFLFDDILDGTFTGTFSDSVANFIARPTVGVNSFADVIEAILEGRAYFNIYTLERSFGGGELRGQIELPVIGTANVDQAEAWQFNGKSTASPGTFRQVNVRSTGGVTVLGVPLQLR